jgi:tRNA (guanine-N7-)-methyltransferase
VIQQPRPFDPKSVPLPRSSPIGPWPEHIPVDIEIGCGSGLHPIRYASSHPDRVLFAIEHTKERFGKFSQRLTNHPPIANLYAIHDDAVRWISHVPPTESVSRVFILYPNPYPMAKHLNRRWHAMPFMQRIIKLLKPGGKIEIATNEVWYANEARQYMQEVWKLALIEDKEIYDPSGEQFKARSHFERKYLKRGETCYNLGFSKK